MENEKISWFARKLAEQEKRFLNMMIEDLNEIEKMPEFAIKAKLKKIKKKYRDFRELHK